MMPLIAGTLRFSIPNFAEPWPIEIAGRFNRSCQVLTTSIDSMSSDDCESVDLVNRTKSNEETEHTMMIGIKRHRFKNALATFQKSSWSIPNPRSSSYRSDSSGAVNLHEIEKSGDFWSKKARILRRKRMSGIHYILYSADYIQFGKKATVF